MAELYRIRSVFTGVPGTPYYSNIYFEAAAGTAADAVAAVGSAWGGMTGRLAATMVVNVQPEVAVIESTTGDIVRTEVTPGATNGFTGAGDRLPTANQVLVRLRTGVYNGGREIRGRIFLPGPTEALASNGVIDPSEVSVIQGNWNSLALNPGSNLVVWSKTTGTFAPVASVTVWNQFAVLRSRRD